MSSTKPFSHFGRPLAHGPGKINLPPSFFLNSILNPPNKQHSFPGLLRNFGGNLVKHSPKILLLYFCTLFIVIIVKHYTSNNIHPTIKTKAMFLNLTWGPTFRVYYIMP